MSSPERRKAPSIYRFDSVPLTQDSLQARGDYLEAYQNEVAPLVSQRTVLGVDLEMAAYRLLAVETARGKDETIRRLQAELLAMGGDSAVARAIPTNDLGGSAEAQADYDALHTQITNLDARIEEADAKLLARFGLS